MLSPYQLRQFADILEATARGLRDVAEGRRPEPPPEPGAPLSQCNLSVRTKKICSRLGVRTVGELAALSEADVTRCKNAGVAVLNELREALRQHGEAFAS